MYFNLYTKQNSLVYKLIPSRFGGKALTKLFPTYVQHESCNLWDITQRIVVIPISTFRDNIFVPSSGFKQSKKKDFFLDFSTLEVFSLGILDP